jgi:hypothetical protein
MREAEPRVWHVKAWEEVESIARIGKQGKKR